VTESGGLGGDYPPDAGVGKSISLRRFARGLDEKRVRVVAFGYLPTKLEAAPRPPCR